MQYTLSINQTKALEWGLNSQQALLFSFVYECPSWCKPVTQNSVVFYAISKQKIIDELPLLTDKPDTAYRLLKQLESKGVIALSHTRNITLVRITEAGQAWNRDHKGSEKIPNKGRKNIRDMDGKKSDMARKKIRSRSEDYPTNQDTSNPDTSNPDTSNQGDDAVGVDAAPECEAIADQPESTPVQPEQPAEVVVDAEPDEHAHLFDRHDVPELPARVARASRERFAMHWQWVPGPEFGERCRMAGVVLARIEGDQAEALLGEFRSYWESRGDEHNHGQWEHKLLAHLKRNTVTSQYPMAAGSDVVPSGGRPDSREARRQVSAALMDIGNTDW